jgi:hypothetical protein
VSYSGKSLCSFLGEGLGAVLGCDRWCCEVADALLRRQSLKKSRGLLGKAHVLEVILTLMNDG